LQSGFGLQAGLSAPQLYLKLEVKYNFSLVSMKMKIVTATEATSV